MKPDTESSERDRDRRDLMVYSEFGLSKRVTVLVYGLIAVCVVLIVVWIWSRFSRL